MIHKLKTLPRFFSAIVTEEKNFEVRKNDRDFKVGDILVLQEYDIENGYTSRSEIRVVGYLLQGGQFGIEKDYCVLGFLNPWR